MTIIDNKAMKLCFRLRQSKITKNEWTILQNASGIYSCSSADLAQNCDSRLNIRVGSNPYTYSPDLHDNKHLKTVVKLAFCTSLVHSRRVQRETLLRWRSILLEQRKKSFDHKIMPAYVTVCVANSHLIIKCFYSGRMIRKFLHKLCMGIQWWLAHKAFIRGKDCSITPYCCSDPAICTALLIFFWRPK